MSAQRPTLYMANMAAIQVDSQRAERPERPARESASAAGAVKTAAIPAFAPATRSA